jgi:hypothetical protein
MGAVANELVLFIGDVFTWSGLLTARLFLELPVVVAPFSWFSGASVFCVTSASIISYHCALDDVTVQQSLYM